MPGWYGDDLRGSIVRIVRREMVGADRDDYDGREGLEGGGVVEAGGGLLGLEKKGKVSLADYGGIHQALELHGDVGQVLAGRGSQVVRAAWRPRKRAREDRCRECAT